jgi:taurine---2-oxoglutarate transaminase
VELVRNRRTKQPFNTRQDKISGKPLLVDRITAEMLRRGVAAQVWLSHFVIAPPLIISQEEIDEGVRALDESLHLADREAED